MFMQLRGLSSPQGRIENHPFSPLEACIQIRRLPVDKHKIYLVLGDPQLRQQSADAKSGLDGIKSVSGREKPFQIGLQLKLYLFYHLLRLGFGQPIQIEIDHFPPGRFSLRIPTHHLVIKCERLAQILLIDATALGGAFRQGFVHPPE